MDKTLIVFKRFMLQHFVSCSIKMTPPMAFLFCATIWVICSERELRRAFVFRLMLRILHHEQAEGPPEEEKIDFRHLLIKVLKNCVRLFCAASKCDFA